jgi:predicted acyltransferase
MISKLSQLFYLYNLFIENFQTYNENGRYFWRCSMNITVDERVFQENELPDDNRLNHGHTRIPSIDGFRGIAIVLMFIGNYIANVRWIPKELKHSPDIGLTIADLVAPMFIFAMALTFGPSLTRKQNQFGKRVAFGKMTVRSLSMIGIGAIITAGAAFGSSTSVSPSWGVLQCLGMASLILLIVASIHLVNTRGWIRLIIGLMLLIIYQFLIDRFFLQEVLRSSQNGLLGTLSWGGMLIIAAVIADQFYVITEFGKRTALLLTTGSGAIIVGIIIVCDGIQYPKIAPQSLIWPSVLALVCLYLRFSISCWTTMSFD